MSTQNLPARIAVITTPEGRDQEWMARLEEETWVGRVDRLAVLTAGIEMAQRGQVDLVIIDRELNDAEAAARQMYAVGGGVPYLAIVPELSTTVMRRLLHAGVRDVLSHPVAYTDLTISLRAILDAEQERKQAMATQDTRRRGKLVVVTSPKGGVGTTTIAVNLSIALRQLTSAPVALADFGLQFGDVGVHLNIWSRYTLQNLIGPGGEIDDGMLAGVLQEHKSGVKVLLAPNEPEVAGEVTGEQLDLILNSLLDRFSYVVIDTWSFLDEVSLKLIERADEVLVVATPEIPTLKNAKHFLGYNKKHSLSSGRITLVLNRFPSVEGISLQDVQNHLGYPIGANIPSEGHMITHSINQGVPMVLSNPKSWAAQSIQKLAAYISGDRVDTLSLTPDSKRPSRDQGSSKENRGERRGLLRFVRRES